MVQGEPDPWDGVAARVFDAGLWPAGAAAGFAADAAAGFAAGSTGGLAAAGGGGASAGDGVVSRAEFHAGCVSLNFTNITLTVDQVAGGAPPTIL